MKDEETDVSSHSEPIHFVEFMEICADSGIINQATARRICLFAKYQGGVGALPALPERHENYEERFANLLSFNDDETRSFDNYIVSEDNYHSIELARTVALIPRIWKNLSPVLFYGQTGQGKSHLLSAMAKASRQRTLLLNTNDLLMEYKYCVQANKDLDLLNWITSHNFLLLDDIQFAQGNFGFQNFLCSVLNRLSSDRNAVVLCSNMEPRDTRDYHITFYSRITSGITIELIMLDFNARVALLKQKFSHIGFGPGDEVINYIASEITSNVRTLKAAARAVVACLLSTPGSSSIELETVKRLLESMHFYDAPGIKSTEIQCDPDVPKKEPVSTPDQKSVVTCSEAVKTSVDSSPFIVIDIEDEEFPLEKKKSEEEVAHIHEEESVPVEEEADDSGQYRSLLASAVTVDKQIEALLLAAGKRIEQLKSRNANPVEIVKLLKAVEHLNNKDIEAAMQALK
jgi:DNA replication protein DnaC